jgi:MFS family permease
VDSLILLLQSITAGQAALEFKPSYPKGMTIAAYSGMLIGALFWGISADVIGRKFAFNFSLIVCSVFAIVAGSAPNWPVLGLFIALSAFGGGGNLVLDTAVFLEYLPSKHQWMLTLMAAWWGAYLFYNRLHSTWKFPLSNPLDLLPIPPSNLHTFPERD